MSTLDRDNEPLYFDPEVLELVVERGLDKEPDGTLIAEDIG